MKSLLFDFSKWDYKLCITKEEAKKEIDKIGIIGDEIQEIIILDVDKITSSPYYLTNIYYNEVLITNHGADENEFMPKINNFKKTNKTISLEDFPDGFKYSCSTYSDMPLILKMKSGKCFELYHWEHFENKNSNLSWNNELMLSVDNLKKYINGASPIMDYNKLYNCILNKKITDINYDSARYYKAHHNKLDDNSKISCVNIEFENGMVMMIKKSGPDCGYFIGIFDIETQTFENFSVFDFKECFLGNIEDVSKV